MVKLASEVRERLGTTPQGEVQGELLQAFGAEPVSDDPARLREATIHCGESLAAAWVASPEATKRVCQVLALGVVYRARLDPNDCLPTPAPKDAKALATYTLAQEAAVALPSVYGEKLGLRNCVQLEPAPMGPVREDLRKGDPVLFPQRNKPTNYENLVVLPLAAAYEYLARPSLYEQEARPRDEARGVAGDDIQRIGSSAAFAQLRQGRSGLALTTLDVLIGKPWGSPPGGVPQDPSCEQLVALLAPHVSDVPGLRCDGPTWWEQNWRLVAAFALIALGEVPLVLVAVRLRERWRRDPVNALVERGEVAQALFELLNDHRKPPSSWPRGAPPAEHVALIAAGLDEDAVHRVQACCDDLFTRIYSVGGSHPLPWRTSRYEAARALEKALCALLMPEPDELVRTWPGWAAVEAKPAQLQALQLEIRASNKVYDHLERFLAGNADPGLSIAVVAMERDLAPWCHALGALGDRLATALWVRRNDLRGRAVQLALDAHLARLDTPLPAWRDPVRAALARALPNLPARPEREAELRAAAEHLGAVLLGQELCGRPLAEVQSRVTAADDRSSGAADARHVIALLHWGLSVNGVVVQPARVTLTRGPSQEEVVAGWAGWDTLAREPGLLELDPMLRRRIEAVGAATRSGLLPDKAVVAAASRLRAIHARRSELTSARVGGLARRWPAPWASELWTGDALATLDARLGELRSSALDEASLALAAAVAVAIRDMDPARIDPVVQAFGWQRFGAELLGRPLDPARGRTLPGAAGPVPGATVQKVLREGVAEGDRVIARAVVEIKGPPDVGEHLATWPGWRALADDPGVLRVATDEISRCRHDAREVGAAIGGLLPTSLQPALSVLRAWADTCESAVSLLGGGPAGALAERGARAAGCGAEAEAHAWLAGLLAVVREARASPALDSEFAVVLARTVAEMPLDSQIEAALADLLGKVGFELLGPGLTGLRCGDLEEGLIRRDVLVPGEWSGDAAVVLGVLSWGVRQKTGLRQVIHPARVRSGPY